MSRRPTMCLDTAVCINAGNGTFPIVEWRRVWRFVTANFEYAILHPVLVELTLGVAYGDECHFKDNQAAAKILYPARRKRFLPMPGAFLLRTVLGLRLPGDESYSVRVQREAQAVVLASSKKELVSGDVPWPKDRRYSVGMDLDMLRGQTAKGQGLHVASLERLRNRELRTPPSPSDWVRGSLHPLKSDLTNEQCERVASQLDAAYRYDCFLWNEARAGKYDFSKHRSDWIDSHLLLYLADPSIHLLVHDRKLKSRIAGSPQSERVHDYADFIRLATAGENSNAPLPRR